jgi:segregation and condensation protein A
MERPAFEVRLEGFSGPLDLLCALVESRRVDPTTVRLSSLLEQYVLFLAQGERVSLPELAEFFALAGRLILRKVRALLPQDEPDVAEAADLPEEEEERDLSETLARYRPYRAAAAWLAERKRERERRFVRESEEGPSAYEAGDLYALASLWWLRVEERSRARKADREGWEEEFFPRMIPEEVQVERRMEEIGEILAREGAASLEGLLTERSRARLLVTLLALLELSRLGRLRLVQSDLWGEIALVRVS